MMTMNMAKKMKTAETWLNVFIGQDTEPSS
jgi:hypothetical protein